MRIEPCVVQGKNLVIFKNKITFKVLTFPLKYAQDIGLILKVFNKFKSDFKVVLWRLCCTPGFSDVHRISSSVLQTIVHSSSTVFVVI